MYLVLLDATDKYCNNSIWNNIFHSVLNLPQNSAQMRLKCVKMAIFIEPERLHFHIYQSAIWLSGKDVLKDGILPKWLPFSCDSVANILGCKLTTFSIYMKYNQFSNF